jgi:hypothetical protein
LNAFAGKLCSILTGRLVDFVDCGGGRPERGGLSMLRRFDDAI